MLGLNAYILSLKCLDEYVQKISIDDKYKL